MWVDITRDEFYEVMDSGKAKVTAQGELYVGGTYCEYVYQPDPTLHGVEYRIEHNWLNGKFYFYRFT